MGRFFAKICTNFVIKKMRVKIVCFYDGFGYRYKRIQFQPFCVLHRCYTDCRNPQKRFWGFGRFSGKNCRQDTRTATTMYWVLHTILEHFSKIKGKNRRFLPQNSLYNCFRTLPSKNHPDTRTKTAQKRRKKCFTHTLHMGPKHTGFFADFRILHNFEKSLDFCGQLIYYSVRYSGIVQSVEQRTVNPYVTGSSPVARATNSVAKPLILRRFSLLTLLDLDTLQSTQKHRYLTP